MRKQRVKSSAMHPRLAKPCLGPYVAGEAGSKKIWQTPIRAFSWKQKTQRLFACKKHGQAGLQLGSGCDSSCVPAPSCLQLGLQDQTKEESSYVHSLMWVRRLLYVSYFCQTTSRGTPLHEDLPLPAAKEGVFKPWLVKALSGMM